MSILGGGKSKGTGPTRLNDLAVQSSSLGLAITKGWGMTRIKANLLWYGDFKSVAKTQKQGGKGTVKSTTYTYFASVIMGLAEGPIVSVPTVYKDKEIKTLASEQLGLALGAVGQSPWSYLTSNHPTEALGYSEIAYVYASNYPLSESATLPNHSFEVKFTAGIGASPDANPKDILTDVLTSPTSGLPGWASGLLGNLTDYSNYCLAEGLLLSPALEAQENASDFIQQQLIEPTNSDIFWSEGVLKVKPRGDRTVTGNSVTWTPDLTPIYDLNEDDFLGEEDPVTQEIVDQTDAYNKVQIEYLDRTNQYNTAIETAQDLSNIITYGARKEDPVTIHSICNTQVANKVANIRLNRKLYIRENYKFKLDDRYVLLEQGDYVTLTTTSDKLKLDRLPVRIIEIEEDEEGNYDVTAEGVTFNTASPALFQTHPSSGYISDEGVAPGNVTNPVIMNAPISLTNGVPEVWVAAGSTSSSWGGCEVWTSFDNTNYSFQGLIDQPGRYGTLQSPGLPLANDPDTTNTLKVDLSSSQGQLLGTGTAERDTGVNLCLIDDEILSFQNATLTGSFTYNLTSLRRGLYNSFKAAHATGAKFLRVDDNILRLDYTKLGIGRTVYFKFLSFNVYGKAIQQLSDVSPVTFYSLPKLDRVITDTVIYEPFNYDVPGEAEAYWTGMGTTLNNTDIFSVVPDTNTPGGSCLRVGQTQASGLDAYQAMIFRQSIPYDKEDIYRLTGSVEIEPGAKPGSVLYVGLLAEDINGNNINFGGDTYMYVGVFALDEATNPGVITFDAYVSGTNNTSGGGVGSTLDNPTPLPTGTVRIRPIILANYPGSAAFPRYGFIRCHELTLAKVEDATVRFLGDWSSTFNYRLNDGVRSAENRTFRSRINNNLNHQPPTTATSDTFWRLVQDAPANGVNAKLLALDPSSTVIKYDKMGAVVGSQTVKLTIRAQNLSATTGIIRAYRLNANGTETQLDAGAIITSSGTTFTDNTPDVNSYTQGLDAVFLTGGNFAANVSTGQGIIVEVVSDGITTRQLISRLNDGADGLAGTNNAIIFAYQRSSSGAPALPSATITYDFAAKTITGLNNGWTQTIPVGTTPLYVIAATASSNTPTDTVASGEWASAQLLSGNDGATGLNGAPIFIFQRNNTGIAPAVPSVTTTYTFSSGVLAGLNNGWTQNAPDPSGGKYLFMTSAAAISTGPNDTIASGEWAAVKQIVQDGNNGLNGDPGYTVSPGSQGFTINVYANSSPKPGSFNKTVTYKVLQGTVDLSTDVNTTYTILSFTGMAAGDVSLSGNVLTISGMNADQAKVIVSVKRSGVEIAKPEVNLTKAYDGTKFNSGSASVAAMPSSSTFTQLAAFTISVPNGATLGVSAHVQWQAAASGSGTYGGEIRCSYQNITDGGAEVFGSTVAGDIIATNTESATADANASFSNSLGATKNVTVRVYGRRTVGTSASLNTTGTLQGDVS